MHIFASPFIWSQQRVYAVFYWSLCIYLCRSVWTLAHSIVCVEFFISLKGKWIFLEAKHKKMNKYLNSCCIILKYKPVWPAFLFHFGEYRLRIIVCTFSFQAFSFNLCSSQRINITAYSAAWHSDQNIRWLTAQCVPEKLLGNNFTNRTWSCSVLLPHLLSYSLFILSRYGIKLI